MLSEAVQLLPARATIRHLRPRPDGSLELLSEQEVTNVLTKAGRDFLHQQGYGASGLGSNGLNWIALSDDSLTEDADSTVLSNEIVASGLARAQGTVAHATGTSTTTISKPFTATGAQSARKAALFSAGSAGAMQHVLSFTQKSLEVDDLLIITFTITLGA